MRNQPNRRLKRERQALKKKRKEKKGTDTNKIKDFTPAEYSPNSVNHLEME
jgi:hypothetical protein